MIEVKVIAHSINMTMGNTIITFLLTYPRIIHCELMTHRLLTKNTASSRAIPVSKMNQWVDENPYKPEKWWRNRKGMSAATYLDQEESETVDHYWELAKNDALWSAARLDGRKVHKQLVNRLTEPFQHIQCVVTATQWKNFFDLRMSTEAQPEIQELASKMFYFWYHGIPSPTKHHLPFITEKERDDCSDINVLYRVSAARCARVSYLYSDKPFTLEDDKKLATKLLESRHLSPFEHPAVAFPDKAMMGSYVSWCPYRKVIEGESGGDIVDNIPIWNPKQIRARIEELNRTGYYDDFDEQHQIALLQ